MPIYEYRCTSCGHEKEVLQKLADPPLTECPACGKPTLGKLVSAAGFHLKGSGWYATDFKGGAKPKDATQDGKDKSDGKDKQKEARSKEQPASKDDTKASKEPTTAAAKAPLPASTADKAD
ncbi:MAG: FmdB family zinc ribbon protein [Betaproteobacteria bacterium]